ncbi:MAG: hypothetical protein PHH14_03575 [Candidatus Margulisbacteria bacterium]|nr:hypothetical protein [Candidatus Margulisiibacteriota bacterium]
MEILGLLDTLESIVLDSPKVPFTKKVMVSEEEVLKLIDKIRNVVQGGSHFAQEALGRHKAPAAARGDESAVEAAEAERRPQAETKAVEVLEQSYQMAKEIREGADKYADEVLANLEATSTRILRTVKAGRDRLAKTTQVGSESK